LKSRSFPPSLGLNFHTHIPSEHHDGGLRVGAGGVLERGAVDHPQSLHAEHPVIVVHDGADLAPAVVMPDGHDGVPAVLLGRPGVVDVPRQEVDGEVGGVGEDGLRGSVGVGEVGEGPGLDHALDRLDAAHATLQVLRLLEVVERHRRVRARVGGPQLDVARGDGAQDLLQDESAPERPPVQPPHRLRRALQGLWGSLLRRQRAQLPRLRREEAEAASQATGALGDGDAELGAAHALDEAAGPGDPDDLHERQRDGHRRRDEHRVHRVVSHALPDHGLVHQHLDAVRLQVRLRADAAQHQQLRAPQRPRRQDHLVLGAVAEVHPVLHPERVREHHTVRHRVRHALCRQRTILRFRARSCQPALSKKNAEAVHVGTYVPCCLKRILETVA
jgi:hypothetical protein